MLLKQIVIGTGGNFTLTFYNGLAADAPAFITITNPNTGDAYPLYVPLEQGLSYTLEGTPGSVTILYNDMPQ